MAWRAESKARAQERWKGVQELERRKEKDWLAATRRHLAQLAQAEILGIHEQSRLKELKFSDLAGADQERIKSAMSLGHLFAFGLAKTKPDADEPLASRFLRLNNGRNLRDVRLSLQVFVDKAETLPAGMNIQLRGLDPHRERQYYLRYDLDVVPMGSGQVTHFNAHWHAGDDPDAQDAEEHDPRLPSLILDPIAVLDVLIETFFPHGPADVIDE